MSLGAAGCGHPESRCEYLAPTLFGFRCKKYDADLKMWKDEPKRLRRCGDDAHKEWAKLREEQKRVSTTRQRGGGGKINRDMYTIKEAEKAMEEYLKLQEQASYYYAMYCNVRRRLGLTTNALDFLNKRDNAKKKMRELKERYNLIFQQ